MRSIPACSEHPQRTRPPSDAGKSLLSSCLFLPLPSVSKQAELQPGAGSRKLPQHFHGAPRRQEDLATNEDLLF